MNQLPPHGGDTVTFAELYGRAPLDFSANTNPLGLAPAARAAVIASLETADRYPDPQCRALVAALAAHEGLAQEQILCGNGAADLIYRLVQVLKPLRALVTVPSFAEYGRALRQAGCQVKEHQLERAHGYRLTEAILAHITPELDLLFLCEPNNPTGLTTDPALLAQIVARCRETGTYLVVDECFNGFLAEPARHSIKPYLADTPRLLILKAFTKLYGMAGLRLGYLLGAPELLAQIGACGAPWSVSSLAQAAGIAALTDHEYLAEARALIPRERARLGQALREAGCHVYPAEANFIFFETDHHNLDRALAAEGIMIRACANYTGLQPGQFRIAVRNAAENDQLVAALRKLNSPLLVIIDGMTDEQGRICGMPALADLLAEQAHGLLETTPVGMEPETVACVLTLLGLPAAAVRATGRGWLEALGAGVPFGPRDLICKASWVAVDAAGVVTGLCDAPCQPADPRYHALGAYRALLVLPDLAGRLATLRTRPPHQSTGQPLQALWPEGCAELLALCQSLSGDGYALIPWGEAAPGKLPQIGGAMITAVAGLQGVAKACGMRLVEVAGATGDTDTPVRRKLDAALRLARAGEFVVLHFNGADEAAHRQDARAKLAFLAKLDREVIPVLRASGHKLLICADHGTSARHGSHLGGPQPFVLAHDARKGDLGLLPGNAAYELLRGGMG